MFRLFKGGEVLFTPVKIDLPFPLVAPFHIRPSHVSLSLATQGNQFHYNSRERDPFDILMSFPDKIVKIVCGNLHTVILTEKSMYGIGSNKHNQLSFLNVPDYTMRIVTLMEMTRKYRVRDVSAGVSSTIFITEQGSLFLCGGTIAKECGHEKSAIQCSAKIVLDSLNNNKPLRFSKVYCGYYFTFLITRTFEK